MIFKNVKKWAVLAGVVKKLTCADVTLWQDAPKNWVKYSTEADGVTIYNGGLGYKDKYRVRSGGAEASQGEASCTGFIPVQPGDVIRISGALFSNASTSNAINVSTSDYTNVGQLTPSYPEGGYGWMATFFLDHSWKSVVEESTGVWRWVVPPKHVEVGEVKYIRVTGRTNGDGSKLIVTKNEEIA